jgi:hypothetical protein
MYEGLNLNSYKRTINRADYVVQACSYCLLQMCGGNFPFVCREVMHTKFHTACEYKQKPDSSNTHAENVYLRIFNDY